jgi:hypothetical protein
VAIWQRVVTSPNNRNIRARFIEVESINDDDLAFQIQDDWRLVDANSMSGFSCLVLLSFCGAPWSHYDRARLTDGTEINLLLSLPRRITEDNERSSLQLTDRSYIWASPAADRNE